MSDRNIQGKKEGNRKRVDRNFEQQKQRLSKTFACSFSTGSYTTLCSPKERCLKSAQHQPEIVYGRQKAELSSQHLYALNAPEKTKKTSDLPNWQRIKCAKQHQMRNRKVRPEKKKTKNISKETKRNMLVAYILDTHL